MLEESGDEEESDQIVSQVLDEIGIEMSGKVNERCCNKDIVFNICTFFFIFRCPRLQLLLVIALVQQLRN